MAKFNKTDLTIHVGAEKLSDGSLVWNVYFGDDCKTPLHAYSEEDARELARGMVELIEKHAVDTIRFKAWEIA